MVRRTGHLMAGLSGAAVLSAGLFFISALLTCLYISHVFDDDTIKIRSGEFVGRTPAFVIHLEKVWNIFVKTWTDHAGITQQPLDAGSSKCLMTLDSRFDCSRDRVLTRSECQERGCCYVPLALTSGPPWCYYPRSYSGYKMGPLSPTKRGRGATLLRPTPSYLPRDISTLRLEVIEETPNCFHLTVSFSKSGIFIFDTKLTTCTLFEFRYVGMCE